MPGPRQLVPPPTFVDRNFGLLSVVQPRYSEPDSHWRNGVTYQPMCGNGGSTYDDSCVTGSAPSKIPNVTTPIRGATPFVVVGEWSCSMVGYSIEEARAKAAAALTNGESWQVERTFATGSVAISGGAFAVPNIAYPHLAAAANVFDTQSVQTIYLQTAAGLVTGSTVVDIVEGIGYLEAAAANCNNGQPVIHIPLQLAEQCFRANIVRIDGTVVKTQHGSLVAFGAGYPGTDPSGNVTPGALWIYLTGQVFAYRSLAEEFDFKESFDRSENTALMIAERTYVLGWDCCHYAVPVSVGGIVTGIVGSPL